MNQCGVAEMALRSINKCSEALRPQFASKILLVGGSSKFCNFRERLYKDLRNYAPSHWDIRIFQEPMPEYTIWRGACNLVKNEEFLHPHVSITKAYWDETGRSRPSKK
eukprot:Platyproteum_vivax@DN6114_c0_g1_i1.p1